MGKRAAAAAPVSAKAAKKTAPKVDPIEKKCNEVIATLKEFEPEAVGTLFGDVLPLSLALCQEERHSYQQGVVDMVAQEFVKHEQALESAITEAEAKVEQLSKDREEKETAVTALEATLQEKSQQAQEKKHALADAALDFRAAKEGLQEAQAKQKAGDRELDQVARKHDGLATAITQILEPLKEGTLDKEQVPGAAAQLVPTLQKFFHVEESLVPAIPTVLSKEPSARGSFDTMAAANLEEQAKKALQDFAAIIKNGEAAKAERAAAVEVASEALTAARNAQRVSAGVFKAAQGEEDAAQAAVASGKTEIRAMAPEKRLAGQVVYRSKLALQTFQDGPMVAFQDLSARSNQAPEEPAPAAEATETAEVDEPAEAAPAEAPDAAMVEAETATA